MNTQPGLRILFHKTDGDTYRSIAPVTARDKDAFFTLLAQFNIDPNASTRPRDSNDRHDAQAAFISDTGRIVCDQSVAEKLERAGVPLNLRPVTKPVV